MSGGVDSATAAAMLVEEGYEAVGVTLRLYDHQGPARPGSCCAGGDIEDARRVADALGISHYVLDLRERFRTEVIEPFADAYLAGETPIPCVLCNQTVKFSDLLTTARDLGADALATGHYVRWRRGPAGPELLRGADPLRDQSYFLFSTTLDQLARLRFPLGRLGKDETRALARRHRLPVAGKAASQDICFVPAGGYARMLGGLRPGAAEPGEIVDRQGRVLGQHRGIAGFTVGQRRGLGIAAVEPLYVLDIDARRRQVVVGPRAALYRRRLRLGDVNWLLGGVLPEEAIRLSVKLRSTRPPAPATVYVSDGGRAEVVLDLPEAGIAPGQACVFYAGERLLGGGWIRASEE